ncbi:MAG TPA: hypothetical protein VLJ41_09250 [Segetibacter sp.]|nr:hypothetical protein [Segetibacter sp.]
MTYIKNNLLSLIILVALIVFFILFAKGCFQVKGDQTLQPTVTIKRDTQYIVQPPVTIPQYQPIIVKTEPAQPTVIPKIYQETSTDIKELTRQVKELAAQFYAINHYRDSIQLKDSSGNNVGMVRLDDAVSQNQIQSRNPSYSLRLPVITNTITIDHPYQPKNQLYLGGGIVGARESFVQQIEAGILLRNKQDQMYGLKAGIDVKGNVLYGLQSYWKIKFRK